MIRRWLGLLGVAPLCVVLGCKQTPTGNCMNMMPSAIVQAAQSFRLDVYPDSVACVGNGVGTNAGQPQQTQSFAKGSSLQLSIPPGNHTFVLTAFSDGGGKMEIGSGCMTASLSAGQLICIDINLSPPVDAGVRDMTTCGGDGAPCPCATNDECQAPTPLCSPDHKCVQCLPTADNCPSLQYCTDQDACAPGCKKDSECAGLPPPDGGAGDGGAPKSTPFCQVAKHLCVQCLSNTDCDVGQVCSQAGVCVDGCDLSQGKGCKPGATCCNKLCVDTRTDPFNCGQCNMQCQGNQTLCCNSVCANPLADVANCGTCGNACNPLNDTPSCANGNCAFACNAGFAHCAMGNTGCETPTNTVTNCGGCGNLCDQTNAQGATCDGTKCSYVCKPGFGDCVMLGADTDGCESMLNTVQNCGGCGNVCNGANATMTSCNGTTCVYVCKQGFADCNMMGADTDGCETDLTKPSSCGGCGMQCDTMNSIGAVCTNGNCTYTGCKPGFADCNKNPPDFDGCESSLSSTSSCGGCGNVCSNANANSVTCDGTKCSYACKPGFGNCTMLGANTNGCDTALNTVQNCSGCGVACDSLHSNGAACNGQTCTYTSCKAGFADCNMNAPDADGCETAVNTIQNCGACGAACDTVNSNGAACINGGCTYTGCKAGFADCVMGAPDLNGCETNVTTTQNCGGCGNVCNLVNANSATCTNGKCVYQCKPGFMDCVQNGADTDGCETNVATSTTNCGGCGSVCNGTNATATSCAGGVCMYTCKAGFMDCVMMGADLDGCETNVTNDFKNCGGCNKACDTVHSVGATCVNSACVYQGCNPGFGDCDSDAGNYNGCETSLTTTMNCGGCGNVCKLTNASGASCNGVSCTYTCNMGFGDCNANMPPDTDGCELAINTILNCGACGAACDTLHSNGAACNGTMCTYTSCKAGWVDCDNNVNGTNSDGCESPGPHINGLGQTYSDCADPLGTPGNGGTYNINMATLARTASTIVGADTAGTCGVNLDNCVARGNNSTCAVWCYSGASAGYVHQNGAKMCLCPTPGGDPTWN